MEKKYLMSSAQKSIFTINEINGSNTVYNIPCFLRVRGNLDVEKLENAIKKMIERHEILRTTFCKTSDHLIQKVHSEIDFHLEFEEKENCDENYEAIKFIKPFDLEKGPLFRVKVIQSLNNEYILMLDFHHIIFDAESTTIFINELSHLYINKEILKPAIQYRKYSSWQNKLDLTKQEKYWKNEFSGEIPILDLQTDYIRPQEQSFKGSNLSGHIDEATRVKVKELAREHGVTEFMVFLSAFMATLGKYSRQEEIIVGTPMSGRTHADTHNMLGMFVNTLAIKGELRPDEQFEKLLQEIKDKCLKAYDNQEYQFQDLVEALHVQRDMSRNPIFDVMFVFQNNEKAELKIGDAEAEIINFRSNISKFDITLTLTEVEDGYQINFEYSIDLFKRESIEQMSKHYVKFLKNALDTPYKKLEDISMLDEAEELKVIREFNDTDTEYPREKTVAELFEEQVEKTPDNIAIMFEDEQLTCRELNLKANVLARKLKENYGVQADDFVAIMAERSLQMIVGILAVIKSGGAYVPLDPTYPEDRIRYMLEDASPKAILVYKAEVSTDIPVIDLADSKVWEGVSDNLQHINKPENLIYCIYTSGTTGHPKGTMIINRNVVRLVKNTNYIELSEDTSVLQTGAVSFDASTLEIWGPLLNGGKLCLCNQEVLTDTKRLQKEISEKGVNTLWLTSTLYNQTVETDNTIFKELKYLLVGGEKLSEKHIRMLDRSGSAVRLINGYGPTENTTFTATYEIPEEFDCIPIGKPISNTQVYILNGKEICGIGVPGELCIGGDGLAIGYLNNHELTAEKFVPNPYREGKLYRSGDLVRWMPDGNIEFLGRIDEQVKIRGFRIEPGEIEARIGEIAHIKETAVIVREDRGDKYLCAYVIADKEVSTKDIKEELYKSVPDYMIPAYILQIEKMPVTRNGKLDKKSLPKPEYQNTEEFTAPRNSVEMLIVKAFESILGVERVSVRDSFFDLGGDSIKAIRVVSKIKENGYDTSVKVIMSEKTPEKIAVKTKVWINTIQAQQGEVSGETELTPIQMDFLKTQLSNPNHFNQSLMYECTEMVELPALHKTLSKITEHHDILRSTYKRNKQIIGRASQGKWYELKEYECDEEQIEDLSTSLQSSIDIENGPIMKAGVFRTPERDYLLLIIHHLAVDGVSWRIISEDLESGYRQAKQGKDIKLPDKTTSYLAWAEAIIKYRDDYRQRREIEYWNKVNKEIEKGRMPKNGTKIANKKTIQISLNNEYTAALLKKSNRAYNTEINDLLLTALLRSIHKTMGQNILAVQLEGHGREELGEKIDIERTVGWFTSVYPVVLEKGNDIGHDIRKIKETIRKIPNKGIGYGILKEIGETVFDNASAPDITFNYLGEFGLEDSQLDRVFRQSDKPRGQEIDGKNEYGTSISVNGGVFSGTLTMELSYDEGEYNTETINKICREFETELMAVIDHCREAETTDYTASDFGEQEWTDEEFVSIRKKLESRGWEIERIYPLTEIQKSELYDKIANEESEQYILQTAMKFKKLNVDNMHAAYDALVKKHGVFRNVIIYRDVSIPRQIMLKEKEPGFTYLELSSEDEFEEIKTNDLSKGFDLEDDPLVRITILKVSENDYRLIFTEHHIIVDGWCLGIIFGDLFRYYQLLEAGKVIPEEHGEDYEKYVRYLEAQDGEKSLKYWLNLLEGYTEHAAIAPTGAPDNSDEECVRIGFSLTKEMTEKANSICTRLGVTVNSFVEAVWGILLQKYNNINDVVISKVVSSRNAGVENMEQIVGLCGNMIPMRLKTEKNDTLKTIMVKLQKQAIEGSEHDWFSIVTIQQSGLLVNILESTIMMFENYYAPHIETDAELLSARQQAGATMGIYLVVGFSETLDLALEYNTRIYGSDQIHMILDDLRGLTEFLINNANVQVDRIQMLDGANGEKTIQII